MDGHQANIAAHVAAGSIALVVGLVPLLTRKGGRLHRWSGRTTVGLGLIVLGSAVVANLLFDPPAPLIAATLTAGYQYLSGLRALALTSRGPGPADAGLALTGLGLALMLALSMGEGTVAWTPAIGYSTLGFIAVVTLYDLSRFLWFGAWYRHVRPIDHGVKMIGFYFAMMSAGFGNLLAQFQPLSQLLPSALGFAAMIGFAVWYSLHPIRIAAPHPV